MSKKSFPVVFHDFYKTNGDETANAPFLCEGPSLTRQEFMAECDINTIMAQYDAYLSDPMRSLRTEPQYVNFYDLPDTLMGAMAMLQEASDAFYRLPAVVRREFDNDPALWADYAANPDNLEQMREWGLAEPEKAPEPPMRVEVVNPPEMKEAPQEPPKPGTGGSTRTT